MSTRDELSYYQQRERDEREAASAATDAIAQKAHLDLADAYAQRLAQSGRPTSNGVAATTRD